MRPIDADALKRYMCNKCGERSICEYYDFGCGTIADIDEQPTIEAEPVKHGRWIRGKNKSAFPAKHPAIWHCSCCGEIIRYNDSMGVYQKIKKKVNKVNPRCRRCGAKMDGGAD